MTLLYPLILRLLGVIVAITLSPRTQGATFRNLDFEEGTYFQFSELDWVSIPGWTVKVNGEDVPETDPSGFGLPKTGEGDQIIAVYTGTRSPFESFPATTVGRDRTMSIFGSPQDHDWSNHPFAGFPLDPENPNFITFARNPAIPRPSGGQYISLSQTGNLGEEDKYLWFMNPASGWGGVTVFANDKQLRVLTAAIVDPNPPPDAIGRIIGYSTADLTQFAGQDNVTLEFRYTVSPVDHAFPSRHPFPAQIDELFFSTVNIPEPTTYGLLGLGALWLILHRRRKNTSLS